MTDNHENVSVTDSVVDSQISITAVSYTHLDVYKRQVCVCVYVCVYVCVCAKHKCSHSVVLNFRRRIWR